MSQMGSGFFHRSISLCFLLAVLMCAQDCNARWVTKWKEEDRDNYDRQAEASDGQEKWIDGNHASDHNGLQSIHAKHIENEEHDVQQYTMRGPLLISNHAHDYTKSSHIDHMNPSVHIFFTIDDLKIGKTIPIYFSHKDFSNSYLLSREEANSIPFSSAQLPYLLKLFSFSKDSPQAKAMKYTLTRCELQPIKGETRFCAASLESMLDSARGIFGLGTKFKLVTTSSLAKPTPLQNYTILDEPKEIFAPKIIACHTMPYPYAVFYCHGQESDNKLFQISLGGENGEKVEAAAVCHMDTSQWDPDHASFRVLKIKPGDGPVCHFFPADNLVWVALPALT